jgi:hypothetical protein
MCGLPLSVKAGMDFVACLKLMGNGEQQRCLALHMLSTKSAITPVSKMKGRLGITLTATPRLAATRRKVLEPSLV